MSAVRYQSAGNVRKRAHNVNNVLWTDNEINEVIDRYSVIAHVETGRALSSPWVEGTDDVYEVVRTYVLNASACEILSGLEIDDQGKCEAAAEKALEAIQSGGSTAMVTAHFDLIDGMDEDHYGQQF